MSRTMKRGWLAALVALVVAIAMLPAAAGADTPPAMQIRSGSTMQLESSGYDEAVRIVDDAGGGFGTRADPVTATFIVTYTGFTAQAQAAFQKAVDIWSTRLVSAVPIRINANWVSMSGNALGSAGPRSIVSGFVNAPNPNLYYSIAIANSLAGVDLIPSQPDMDLNFNSARSDWYLGVDANTPSGKFDFVTVVLHELIHGLGFLGTFNKTSSTGTFGISGLFNWDQFAFQGPSTKLLSLGSGTTALGSALTSNNVFLNCVNATAANGGVAPKLYAPTSWAPGSSISHLDESTFAAGSANALITPFLGSSEAIHVIGPVIMGAMKDIGWRISGSGGGVTNPAPVLSSISPASVVVGSPAFTLNLNGTGFIASSVVKLGGVPKTTTFVSATNLRITVAAGDIATVGTRSIAVTNPTPGGGTSGSKTLSVMAAPVTPAVYLNFEGTVTFGGLTVLKEDIVKYASGVATMLFDGSDVGLGASRLDGFQVVNSTTVLLSFAETAVVGLNTFQDEDIVQFVGTLGSATSGTFTMFFDGSNNGLATTSGEDIDGFFWSSSAGKLYLTTLGSFGVTGLSGSPSDIFACNGFVAGGNCTSFSLYFDGDDIGLVDSTENVDAFSIGPDGAFYFSTSGAYTLTGGLSGTGGQVFKCSSPVTGATSSCGAKTLIYNSTANVTGFGLAP